MLTPEFIDAYAIIGMPDRVVERIEGLRKLGIDKLVMHGTRSGVSVEADNSRNLIEAEVLPLFRS